jgi:serine/threonine protein kinase
MDQYEKGSKLGEGTYGIVYQGIDKQSGQEVALKKVFLKNINEGVSFTAYREIRSLLELRHANVVSVC